MKDVPSCQSSSEAAALTHVMDAEKAAAIIPVSDHIKPVHIKIAAIIGAGTMGGGISMALVAQGIEVILIDVDEQMLEKGLSRIKDNYNFSIKRGKLDAATLQTRMSMIQGTTSLNKIRDADIIIEAVFEDMDLKKSIFERIDQHAKAGAILATNTSGLDINEIAKVTSRAQDVVGAHFFSPAHVMRLLEVIRADQTSDQAIVSLMELGRRMGKVAVYSRVYPGFIGNALFRNTIREAHFLLEEGALPHEVDAVLKDFGFPMGIFAVHDLAGNDVGYHTRKAQIATRPNDRRWNDMILKLVEMGRLGQKSSKGWYRYESGDRTPHRDPEIEQFIVEESARLGFTRRQPNPQEILKRCLYGLINEGAKLLDQGIALRASDIDIVYVTGYGFPAKLGGPMYWADTLGIENILEDIELFYQQHGFWWKPAPLLEKLAKTGGKFSELQPTL